MPASPLDPRIAAYLQELDGRLAGADAGIRADTMAEVRSHLATVLGEDPTPGEVSDALERLGPPELIAAASDAPATGPSPRPLAGDWVVPVVLVLQFVGLATPFLLVPALATLAAIVLCWLSPRYALAERIATSCASVAAVVGAFLVLGAGLDSMDGCYEPSIEEPLVAGQPTCEELASFAARAPGVVGGLLVVVAAVVAIVVAVRAARRTAA